MKLENRMTLTLYNCKQLHTFYYESFQFDLQQSGFLTLIYYMKMLILLFYEMLYISNEVS